jgi:hypothetical protein
MSATAAAGGHVLCFVARCSPPPLLESSGVPGGTRGVAAAGSVACATVGGTARTKCTPAAALRQGTPLPVLTQS